MVLFYYLQLLLYHSFLNVLTGSEGVCPCQSLLHFGPYHTLQSFVTLPISVHLHIQFFTHLFISLLRSIHLDLYPSFTPHLIPLHLPHLRLKFHPSLHLILYPYFYHHYIPLCLPLHHKLPPPLHLHLNIRPLPIPLPLPLPILFLLLLHSFHIPIILTKIFLTINFI